MKNSSKIIIIVIAALFPLTTQAQYSAGVQGLHALLDNMYDQMMPLCSELIGVARGIAGFAAIFYIGSRVWRHIANAEPIDFYPLFRPFVLGFCITIFPSVLTMINTVMKPVVTGTASMMEGSNAAIEELLRQREEALKQTDEYLMYDGGEGYGDRDRWYSYTHGGADPSNEGTFESIGNEVAFMGAKMAYNVKHSIKAFMSEVLRVLFEAASLCINTLRTFQLVVLSILGPLVFGLAVFDGFQHTLTAWIARYINIFLWLPVANIFGSIIGKIQQEMIKLDIAELNNQGVTSFFNTTDTAYLIFMIIGIVGYFTVPSVSNFIVNAGGGNGLHSKSAGVFAKVPGMAGQVAMAPVNMVKNALKK